MSSYAQNAFEESTDEEPRAGLSSVAKIPITNRTQADTAASGEDDPDVEEASGEGEEKNNLGASLFNAAEARGTNSTQVGSTNSTQVDATDSDEDDVDDEDSEDGQSGLFNVAKARSTNSTKAGLTNANQDDSTDEAKASTIAGDSEDAATEKIGDESLEEENDSGDESTDEEDGTETEKAGDESTDEEDEDEDEGDDDDQEEEAGPTSSKEEKSADDTEEKEALESTIDGTSEAETGDGTPDTEGNDTNDEQSEAIDKDSEDVDEESAAEVSFKDENPAGDDEEKDDDGFGDDANPSEQNINEPTPDDDQTDDDVRGDDAEDSANRQFFTGDDAEADGLEAGFGNEGVTQEEWNQSSPATVGQAEPSSFSTQQGEAASPQAESTNIASIPTQRYDDDSVSEFGENSGFIGLMLASLVIALLARYIKRRRGAPEMAGYSRVVGDDRYGHSNSYAVNKKN